MILFQIFGFSLVAGLGARFGWSAAGQIIEVLEGICRAIVQRRGNTK